MDKNTLQRAAAMASSSTASATSKLSSGLRFLFWCAQEHVSFRVPEFEAIAQALNLPRPLKWVEESDRHDKPWAILDLASEAEARQIAERSVATKYCVQLWGDGRSYAELHQSVKCFPSDLIKPYCGEQTSFKIYVESFMNSLNLTQRLERIESFDYLPLKGPVKLNDPDVTLSNFEFWGFDHNNLPPEPLRLFFGRCVSHGRRDLITRLSLKKRRFIGNTTMDPQLSLLMANLACVSPSRLVLDPFVGTGALLLAAAQFGAHVMGTDIDYLMLHARTRPSRVGQKKRVMDEHMRGNFDQLGLSDKYVDTLVSDSSRPPWRPGLKFDAIVTDPPYGIRERTEKVGTKKEDCQVPEEFIGKRIPQKIGYELGEIYRDLVSFSAGRLVDGGRLVFFMPVSREDYSEQHLPRHPQMKLVANCEQVLSSHTSRRLLVMEKLPSTSVTSDCDNAHTSTTATTATTSDDAVAPPMMTSAEFRQHFFSAPEIDRKERKERIKKYGHLNLKGDADDDKST